MSSKLWLGLLAAAGLFLAAGVVYGFARVHPTLQVEAAGIAAAEQPFAGKPDDAIRMAALCSTEGQSRICVYQ